MASRAASEAARTTASSIAAMATKSAGVSCSSATCGHTAESGNGSSWVRPCCRHAKVPAGAHVFALDPSGQSQQFLYHLTQTQMKATERVLRVDRRQPD